MIKKFMIIILLVCTVISCGKKSDPKYEDADKKATPVKVIFDTKFTKSYECFDDLTDIWSWIPLSH